MIVKFLAKSKTFKGVRYNTNKVEKEKGELMKVSGFGLLQGMFQLMPQDYINYLQAISARNSKVIYPQLHVVISAKGKDATKEELTDTADKWMNLMGYAQQPYLVIFHKDTRNYHVHVVSTRVDRSSGKKISSAFERIRAMKALNQVMKQDEKLIAKADLERAMNYNFQTKAQFMMILESKGYVLIERDGKLSMIRFGKNLFEIELGFLKDRKLSYLVDQTRASQITAFIHKYRADYSPELRPMTEKLPGGFEKEKAGWTSDLVEALLIKFGIQLVFHGAAGKIPYGYTVLDHVGSGNVFKGGEIMDLKELLAIEHVVPHSRIEFATDIYNHEPDSKSHQFIESSDQLLNSSVIQQVRDSLDQRFINELTNGQFEVPIQISISDDIDDEAIHGRNRQRKRQARTNTR